MFRHSYHPVVLSVIGLAVIGIGNQLFTNTAAFFTQILVTVGIVAIILLIFKSYVMPRLMQRQSHTGNQPMYSSQKIKSKKKKTVPFHSKKDKKKTISRPLIKRPSDVKLIVIEGKKNKKKNRALF